MISKTFSISAADPQKNPKESWGIFESKLEFWRYPKKFQIIFESSFLFYTSYLIRHHSFNINYWCDMVVTLHLIDTLLPWGVTTWWTHLSIVFWKRPFQWEDRLRRCVFESRRNVPQFQRQQRGSCFQRHLRIGSVNGGAVSFRT